MSPWNLPGLGTLPVQIQSHEKENVFFPFNCAEIAVHILVWGASNPNYVGIAVAQMSYPLVRVGTTTSAKGQSEEPNLEAGACVPREFKGEAGRTQAQGWRRRGGPMAGRSLQARDIHLEKA